MIALLGIISLHQQSLVFMVLGVKPGIHLLLSSPSYNPQIQAKKVLHIRKVQTLLLQYVADMNIVVYHHRHSLIINNFAIILMPQQRRANAVGKKENQLDLL
jgi:hypothetical protein